MRSFLFVFAFTLALRFSTASAASQTHLPGPAVTGASTGNCSTNCSYPVIEIGYIEWVQMAITATYIAETVVFVVNKRSNSTRTTTISNTEIDFGKIVTPTNLNSDGTVTASVVDYDGSTRIIAYPTTAYNDYAPNVSWTGTLSTTVSGIPTCSVASVGAVAVFPSHPLLPEAIQATGVNTIEDPRGWTFTNLGGAACGADCRGNKGGMVENLFPDLGVWNCEPTAMAPEAATALQTALYLTKTSTSTESDDGPTSTEAPLAGSDLPFVPDLVPGYLKPATGLLRATSSPTAPGTETFTPNPHSQYLLAPNSPITLTSSSSTTVLALQTSSSRPALVHALTTSLLNPPAITIGSETITANSATQYVIGSQTLTPGGVVTVSGTEVSLAVGESDIVVGASTEALGPYITAGFGTGANGSVPVIFQTGGARGRCGWGWRGVGVVWMVWVGLGVWL